MNPRSNDRRAIKRSSEDRGDWLSSMVSAMGNWCRKERPADDEVEKRESWDEYRRRRESFEERVEGRKERGSRGNWRSEEEREATEVQFRKVETGVTERDGDLSSHQAKRFLPKGIQFLKRVYDSRMDINPALKKFKQSSLREMPRPKARKSTHQNKGFQPNKSFNWNTEPEKPVQQPIPVPTHLNPLQSLEPQILYFDPRTDTFQTGAPHPSQYSAVIRYTLVTIEKC